MVCLLEEYFGDKTEGPDKDEKVKALVNECVRQSNLILNYSNDNRYRSNANKWMSDVYEKLGDYDKAEEYANNLPIMDIDNDRFYQLGYIYRKSKREKEAISFHGMAIHNALEYLNCHLLTIGHCYRSIGKIEEAYICHRFYPDLYDYMVGEREDEFTFYFNTDYVYCAWDCLDLGRPDDALDWLEKYVRNEFLVAKNFHAAEETSLPYLSGWGIVYSAETYPAGRYILDYLKWKCFDPIRDTDRFKALVKAAEETIEAK